MIPIEPGADMRQGAIMMRQFYIALVNAGFTDEQAMELIKVQLASAYRNVQGDDSDA